MLLGIFVFPFIIFILIIIGFSIIGKSFGIRRFYVKILLAIFEYGRVNIESAYNKKRPIKLVEVDEDDDDEDVEQDQLDSKSVEPTNPTENGRIEPSNGSVGSQLPKQNGMVKRSSQNGLIPNSRSIVISRESFVLVPDIGAGESTKDANANVTKTITTDVENKQNDLAASQDSRAEADQQEKPKEEKPLDFKLSNCLDYVKAGMESIIEDEVTSRFEAEELKNWNLLTRTNRNYEFISLRLTILWVIGFFIRYTILMPLRVIICFIGVVWCVLSFSILASLPQSKIQRWLVDRNYKIVFRIIARSITAIINIHNEEHRPKRGFCVANHTSPIDVVILSTECTFSLVYWLTFCTAVVGCVPNGNTKRWLIRKILIHCFEFLSNAISAVINYHNVENRPVSGICVANHTSPIDALVLMCDNCYSLIGQRHGGFLGILQRALARASPHIWFERAEAKDRSAVASRLRQHVSDPYNPPILIFPEGTCINNTSVMQFKKGSFEVDSVIYPVAIKYDARFGDAFWNSTRYSMLQYLYMMMTSWAIVCDVWYLPPMYRQDGESAIDFANRVKSVIAKQGGLVDLVWDGQLKRMKPKKEWIEKQQEEFTKRLKGD